MAQSRKKESTRILFFYSDLHTGFDPRERPERREGEAQEVPRANEAAWRKVAGSHRPEGESCVAQKNRILLGSVFLLEVRLKFIGLALVHWFYLQTPHGLFVIIREPPHTAPSIEKRFERINSVIITLCVRIRVFSLVLSYLFWYTYTMAEEKNIKVVFYKTPSGNEPVRAGLKSLSSDEKKTSARISRQ